MHAGRLVAINVRFPRVFPAASLKQELRNPGQVAEQGFPRVFPAASLKRTRNTDTSRYTLHVFRGYSPRPH